MLVEKRDYIKILGRDIEIREVGSKIMTEKSNDEDCLGLYERGVIYLLNSLSKDERDRVLKHEVAHALFDISGISTLLTHKLEEAICTALEGMPNL